MKPNIVPESALRGLAELIKNAAERHETSYEQPIDSVSGGRYLITIRDACYQVAAEAGIPDVGQLIYLVLDGWWNDTLAWAEEQLTKETPTMYASPVPPEDRPEEGSDDPIREDEHDD